MLFNCRLLPLPLPPLLLLLLPPPPPPPPLRAGVFPQLIQKFTATDRKFTVLGVIALNETR
jgi:hypothetical protein